MSDGGGLPEGGVVGYELCLDSGSIFKAGPTGFAGGLDVGVRENDFRASPCHLLSHLGSVQLVSLLWVEEKHL